MTQDELHSDVAGRNANNGARSPILRILFFRGIGIKPAVSSVFKGG